MIFVFYSLALVSAGTYALLFGGWIGRLTVTVILALFAATTLAAWWIADDRDYQVAAFAIDCLSLTLKMAIAVTSKKRWPIIIAAFQLNSVCAQTAVFVAPTFATKFHYAMTTLWAIPTLFVLALGVFLDRRHTRKP